MLNHCQDSDRTLDGSQGTPNPSNSPGREPHGLLRTSQDVSTVSSRPDRKVNESRPSKQAMSFVRAHQAAAVTQTKHGQKRYR